MPSNAEQGTGPHAHQPGHRRFSVSLDVLIKAATRAAPADGASGPTLIQDAPAAIGAYECKYDSHKQKWYLYDPATGTWHYDMPCEPLPQPQPGPGALSASEPPQVTVVVKSAASDPASR
jgi:hypothetical protein